ncbi:protein-tyrosine phosphatase-like protein [Aspergillus cavernicola]|uniref:Protein-tyrosine phosphatase-like protein n=1 Tax=Aspergillus cavernicola TaxID=176166 RepID=A0ABR4J131_9EURO
MEEISSPRKSIYQTGTPINIEGTYNFRSFGGYPSTIHPNRITRHGLFYRSGHLEDITVRGLDQLHDLSITKIINLATADEAKALFSESPTSPNSGQCTVHNLPLAKRGFSVQQLSEKYKRYLEEGETAIAQGYFKLLVEGHDVIRDILVLIRDNPNNVFLIHCSMGKDRTGIIFAVLLSLAGVPNDTIATEYSLSESSLEIVLPEIAKAIRKAISPLLTEEEAMGRAKIVIKTSKEAMLLTLQMIEENFGSTIEFLDRCCGIGSEDAKRIQDILTSTETRTSTGDLQEGR